MRYVVIGASAAGISGAKTLRELDKEAEIILVSKDENVYSRCILHHYISNHRDVDALNFTSKDFFEENNITWMKGLEVKALNDAEQTLELSNGESLRYDKLLVCSGASAFVPPVPGLREGKNVVGLRNLDNHHADGLADQTLLVPLGDLVRQQRANRTGERLRAVAAAAVGLDDRHALLAEILRPNSRHVRVGQVDAVKDHHARLACRNLIHIRVAGHLRNACVHDLTDRIHLLDILRHLPAGLCHMSGIPLNIHITSPFQNR